MSGVLESGNYNDPCKQKGKSLQLHLGKWLFDPNFIFDFQ